MERLCYIRVTSINILTRVYYHKNNLKLHTETGTALLNHLMEEKHVGNWDDIEIKKG